MAISNQLQALRNYFDSGATKSYIFRKQQLLSLKNALLQNQTAVHEALYKDLKKSPEECWITETGFVLSEINATLKNLRQWMAQEAASTNLVNLPATSYTLYEPLGVTLIISPWNYPFMLLLTPLVGAIAAGNCVVLKSAEYAPATTAVIKKMIAETFPQEYILFTEGDGATVVPALMNNFTFDHVFYTGSTAVGKIIYKMAAERLVPVTLELGGKCPCVVEEDANIKVAVQRIVVTKFSNCGQTCVAPDYILVHESKKQVLVEALIKTIKQFYTDSPGQAYDYGKIINEKQFKRLVAYLQCGNILHGGQTNATDLFIAPTILDGVDMNSPIMKEEIFGPILPIITFKNFEEAKKIIAANPNPLAFYVFTQSHTKEQQWINGVAFGGGCVNNTSWQLTNHHLPFGGRGFSGTGNYHGKYSFITFSHKKAIMKTPTWFNPAIKFPSFKNKLWLFKKVIR
jgi:aldehyde dehydrogenase (NAD+)